MTIRQLRRAMEHYKIILDMHEWTLTAEYVPQINLALRYDDPKYALYGCADIDLAHHKAHISINRPCDMKKLDQRPNVMLTTLLHEMGHVLFDPNSTLAGDTNFELALDRFAACIVGLHG